VLDMSRLICFAGGDAKQTNQALGPGGSRGVGSNRRAVD
jgi:hypothetical protein